MSATHAGEATRTPASPGSATRHGPGLRLQRRCACGANEANLSGACDDCRARRLQPRLTVGPAGDRYEQEADRVAQAVMGPQGARATVGPITPLVQRRATGGGSEGARASAVPSQVHAVLAGPGQPLEDGARQFFESRFGHDFSRVRIHADAAAAASARAVDAHAYTVGEHVVFGAGRYAPGQAAGARLLAHELTHVVQQQAGVLRRASLSAPVTGRLQGEEDASAPLPGPAPEVEEPPIQRLQRVPAFEGLDEAGPQADIAGAHEAERLARIAACLKGKAPDPAECDPTAALTWADFQAAPKTGSPFAAVTASTTRAKDVGSQQCVEEVLGRATGPQRIFQGFFDPAKSWVKARARNADDPARNGAAGLAQQCRAAFDAAARKGQVGVRWALNTTPDANCPASPRPAGTPATTRAECDTTIVKDATAQAVADSARLLNHEQFHFNLTCALARKANGRLWRGADFAAIDAVIRTRLQAAQNQYDDESHHGCDAASQASWEAQIGAGLPKVELP